MIFFRVNSETIYWTSLKFICMAKTGSTIATLLIGAAVGVAVGYVLATDQETRKADLDKLKKNLNNLKGKLTKAGVDQIEEEIYHS
jgi:gas vesicle protein